MSDVFNKPICVEFFKTEGDKGYAGDKGVTGLEGSRGDTGLSYSQYSPNIYCGYGSCNTGTDDLLKVVTIDDYIVAVNSILVIKFSHNVPANSKLNVNSSGDRDIYHR